MSGVTNTQLAVKIDTLNETVHEFKLATEKRVVYLETCLPSVVKDIEKLEGKVDTVQKRGYIVGGFTGALAALGTILGINK